MSELNLYENSECRFTVNQQGPTCDQKPDAGFSVEQSDKKKMMLVIFGLLILCLFFTLLCLVIGTVKVSGMYTELKELQDMYAMELSQFKSNVSEEVQRTQSNMEDELSKLKLSMTEEVKRSQNNMADQLSNLKVGGCSCLQCPNGWVWFSQSCYYFSTSSGTWHFAKQQCSLKESHLLVINSIPEHKFIKRGSEPEQYWIGLTDSVTERHWQWEDGASYDSTPKFWADGEPNNAFNNEDCAHVDAKGQWNDNRCSINLRWICEKNSA
ncbi:CD209 antigen-like protein C isoform X2 [Pristis pectinata]|uniref:CD209 antigen-like protein C isoform X2 n=1 Tax=Pristis pectinata TaxID=685728 RepID=UPI00223E42AD|nr:CD209 antigen-like protein C isoform X2 [Pristis pectinata]